MDGSMSIWGPLGILSVTSLNYIPAPRDYKDLAAPTIAMLSAPEWTALVSPSCVGNSSASSASSREEFATYGDFTQRNARWRTLLAEVLAGSAAEYVDESIVPCAAADVLSALAAFPKARTHTLISREPLTRPTLRDAQVLSPLRELRIPTEATEQIVHIFASARAGAFMLGHLVRGFASRWGVLPLLVTALHAAGISARQVEALSHENSFGLSSGVIDCVAAPTVASHTVASPTWRRSRMEHAHGAGGVASTPSCTPPRWTGRRRFLLRYVQADLSNGRNVTAVRQLLDAARRTDGARGARRRRAPPVVGALIKGAENAFVGGELGDQQAQRSLSHFVLEQADVLLQDSQTGVRWPMVRGWMDHAMPLGTPDLPRDAQAPEHAGLAELWNRWRSLRGLRFGYCRSTAYMNAQQLAAARRHNDTVTYGERDQDELGHAMYCDALLAWRCTAASKKALGMEHCPATSRRPSEL